MKIAISGKGGVGKTTIMGILAGRLSAMGKEVLVIDADPSPHMAQTLGFDNIDAITPIAEMTRMLVERSGKTEGSPFYNINPQIADLPEKYMLHKGPIRLMVLGAIQKADSGCACPENTVLRRLLTKLLLSPSQVILLDMEAGVEHLGRGTIAGVDLLFIVVNPTRSSLRTAEKITRLAKEVKIPRIAYIGNLVQDQEDKEFLERNLPSEPLGLFGDDKAIQKAERDGNPVTDCSETVNATADAMLATIFREP